MPSRSQHRSNPDKEEPFVDLEKVIHEAAWKTIVMPRNFCGFQRPFKRIGRNLMVPWTYLQDETSAKLHVDRRTEKKVTLFETTFNNYGSKDQQFDFQVERCTESSLEMSVQSGVTIGRNMKCSFSITAPGSPVKMSGILGKEMKWDNNVTEKFSRNERLTWGVNAPVIVKRGKRAIVRLSVVQEEIEGDLTITTKSTIISRNNKLPVYALTRKDNKLVACANVGVNSICKRDDLHLLINDKNGQSFHYVSHAKLKSTYCIRQEVSIDFDDAIAETPPQMGTMSRSLPTLLYNHGKRESRVEPLENEQ